MRHLVGLIGFWLSVETFFDSWSVDAIALHPARRRRRWLAHFPLGELERMYIGLPEAEG